MHFKEILPTIERSRIIAILRGDFKGHEEMIVEALFQSGITAVEVTLNSPNALASIQKIARRFGASMAVGAGTVMKPAEVEAAANVGAQFIVSPNCDLSVIKKTLATNLISFPGCFTPSEIVQAINAGAHAAKLFPANSLGPDFVRSLRGPLPELKLIPTGGVTPELAQNYRAAGAWAVGIGSELLGKGEINEDRLKQISNRARQFVGAMS